ncbi:MAG: HigA family addiction module antitoxin [Phycisphaerales bacterium]
MSIDAAKLRKPRIHPGEILDQEFLTPMEISKYRLAQDIHVTPIRITQIVQGRRAVTPDTALRLARYFGTTPEFWLNMQRSYDLESARDELAEDIEAITPCVCG